MEALWVLKQYFGSPFLQARHSPHTARQFQNDEVAFLHVGDRRTYGLYYACGLVAEQEGEGVFNIAIAVGKVGVAHTAGLNAHDDVVRAGIRNDNVDGFDFRALGTGDNSFYSHAPERTIFSKSAHY